MASTISNLDTILNPAALAVIGASSDPSKRGNRAVSALLRDGYKGRIFPVHPSESEILGLPCYPSIDAVPVAVDVVLVCTPASTLPDILEQCGRKGVKGAIVVSGGFSETGEAGRLLEARSVEIARRYGLRIIGPNMNGIYSRRNRCNLSPWKDIPDGELALLSNSANMAHWLLTRVWDQGYDGFSMMMSVGNQADVEFHEYVASLGNDPGTRAIIAYVEGFRQGRAFYDAARTVTPLKPVVMYKAGRNAQGVRMARSHSGSLAGDYAVSRGVLGQAGVVLAERPEHLLPIAGALATLPPMRSRKVAIISEGGGPITVAAEALTERGLVLAPLSARTQERIREVIPRSTAIANPVDIAVLHDPSVRSYGHCARAILEDEGIDGLLFVGWFGAYGRRGGDAVTREESAVAAELVQMMHALGKPVVVQSHYVRFNTAPLEILRAGGVPCHHDFDSAIEVLCAAARYGEALRRLASDRPLPPRPPVDTVTRLVADAATEHGGVLLETDVRDALAAYGVAMPPYLVADTAEALAAAVQRLGDKPLALKVIARSILHKTEAGGVRLGVRGIDAAQDAMSGILEAVRAKNPHARVSGILVTPMAGAGCEVIIGVTRDPQFGLVMMFGLGGVLVEVLRDVVFRALPLARADAVEMMDEIRGRAVLDGVRGGRPADRAALLDLMMTVSALAIAHPEIMELDLNPVIVHEKGYSVVDARMVVRTEGA